MSREPDAFFSLTAHHHHPCVESSSPNSHLQHHLKGMFLVAIGYEQPALTLVHSILLSTTIKTSGSSSSIRTNSQGFGETKATCKTIKMSVEEEETIPFSSTVILNKTNDDNPPYFDTTKKISIPVLFFPLSFHCIISPP